MDTQTLLFVLSVALAVFLLVTSIGFIILSKEKEIEIRMLRSSLSMSNSILTRALDTIYDNPYEERYSISSFNKKGFKPHMHRCCAEVSKKLTTGEVVKNQCLKDRGFGPGLNYCKQHAAKVEV